MSLPAQSVCFNIFDNVSLIKNIDTIQKNTKALLDASKEVGLEVIPEKISIC
jgi:hypothetical protein